MLAHQKLRAWEFCHRPTLAIYHSTNSWPNHELYGLTSQVRRAAVSAAANLAEGAAKRGPREFGRFVDMSLGSLAEVAYLLLLARDLALLEFQGIRGVGEPQRAGWRTHMEARSKSERGDGKTEGRKGWIGVDNDGRPLPVRLSVYPSIRLSVLRTNPSHRSTLRPMAETRAVRCSTARRGTDS